MKLNRDVKILAIIGMSGTGKTLAVDYLTARGIPKVYFGGLLYQEMEKRGLEITPETQGKFREEIRRTEGKDWVARQAVSETKDLIAAGQKRIVLDGVYSWTEYKIFKHEFPGEITVIAIVAPKHLRYDRLAHRASRPFTAAEVRERDRSEIEGVEKGGPIAAADYYILNDSTPEHLYNQLKTILSAIDF